MMQDDIMMQDDWYLQMLLVEYGTEEGVRFIDQHGYWNWRYDAQPNLYGIVENIVDPMLLERYLLKHWNGPVLNEMITPNIKALVQGFDEVKFDNFMNSLDPFPYLPDNPNFYWMTSFNTFVLREKTFDGEAHPGRLRMYPDSFRVCKYCHHRLTNTDDPIHREYQHDPMESRHYEVRPMPDSFYDEFKAENNWCGICHVRPLFQRLEMSVENSFSYSFVHYFANFNG